MTSISKSGKGRRLWLHHKAPKRVAIYLGRITKRQEREILRIVEPLETAAKLNMDPPLDVLRQVDGLHEKLREKLREHGLLQGQCSCLTIGEFGRSWVEKRRDTKDISEKRANDYLKTIKMLEEYFEADTPLRSITVGTAKAFRAQLAVKYAEATVAFRIKMVKCLFNSAVEYEHITDSPFTKVKSGSQVNDRFVYVEKGDIDAIIDDVSCPQWKAMITLWRHAGLRAQEPLYLTWDRVDWANQRLNVYDAKRKCDRLIPLWPEVEAALSLLFDAAEDGATRIITKYKPGQNLGTQFKRIIKQAGLVPWEKPFQNLRASCQNDLESTGHRMTAVNSWIGNSASVAAKHYLKVTDEDFTKALDDNQGLNSVIESVMHSTEQASTGVLQKQVPVGKTAIPADAQVCLKPKTTQYAQQDSNLRPTD